MKVQLLLIVMILLNQATAQVIPFEDLNLKDYLITKPCVDTDQDGDVDSIVDLDGDGEIQISEAESIDNLTIDDLYREFYIQSVQEIQYFKNLKTLKFFANDSLKAIDQLGLDSLKQFWLDGSAFSLKYLDISDLPNVTDLRIEGPFYMDYLNIQNGSVASDYFSLFYTEYIQYACVDSIASEYNEVVWHMDQGLLPTTECLVSSDPIFVDQTVSVHPNPSINGLFTIETMESSIQSYSVFDAQGSLLFSLSRDSKQINLQDFPPGIYLLKAASDRASSTQKIIKIGQ